MLSFCRSGLLALTLMSGSISGTQAQTQRLPHLNWISDVSIERLQDKSVLAEYFGEVVSEKYEDVLFRVGFIPRFGCAPLLTVELGNDALSGDRSDYDPAFFPNELDSVTAFIDGVSLSFPALTDEDANSVSVYMNANLQRRITARIRVELGNEIQFLLRNGKQLTFSLLGSKEALDTANQNCRRHDPLDYN